MNISKPHGDNSLEDENQDQETIIRRNLLKKYNENFLVGSYGTQTTRTKFTEKSSVPILYYQQYSYQAQRVLMVLYEQNINFKYRILNLAKLEQYDSWFLKLSPSGDQPILVDNSNIICDASKIIDYLEMNYKHQSHPVSNDEWELEQHFRHTIDKLPESTLTLGTFYYPELIRHPKGPFRSILKKVLIEHDDAQFKIIQQRIEMYPNYRQQLRRKLTLLEHRKKILSNVATFMQVIELFNTVLDKIERQLSSRAEEKKQWLIGSSISKADISLIILLDRLNNLGLEHMFWKYGKRPNIEKYFQQVQKYPSYIRTKPTPWMNFLFIMSNDPVITALLGVGFISMISLSGFVAYRLFKNIQAHDVSKIF